MVNEANATDAIRLQLGIESRRQLRSDPEKLAEWRAMVRRYENETGNTWPPAGEA